MLILRLQQRFKIILIIINILISRCTFGVPPPELQHFDRPFGTQLIRQRLYLILAKGKGIHIGIGSRQLGLLLSQVEETVNINLGLCFVLNAHLKLVRTEMVVWEWGGIKTLLPVWPKFLCHLVIIDIENTHHS